MSHPIQYCIDRGLHIRIFQDYGPIDEPPLPVMIEVTKLGIDNTWMVTACASTVEEALIDLQKAIDDGAVDDVGKPYKPEPIKPHESYKGAPEVNLVNTNTNPDTTWSGY